jgi:putative toxin-antitoxin system antitoxin component (TIGR02293 family)
MSIIKKQGGGINTPPAPRKIVKKVATNDRDLNTGDSHAMEAIAYAYAPDTEPLPAFWLIAHELRGRSEGERLERIQNGFSAHWVRATRDAFKLSNDRLEALLNASMSTLERRHKHQQPLDAVTSERLDRVAMVATQALDVFEAPEKASRWMVTVNAALGDQTPIHLCESEIGARQVRRVLAALEYGGVV